MPTEPEQSLVQSLRTVLTIVPKREKHQFWFLLFLGLVCALAEIGIAGLVALLAAVFASTDAVLNNTYFLWLKKFSSTSFLEEPRLLSLTILCLILVSVVIKNMLATWQQWRIAHFSEAIAKTAREHLFKFYLRAPFLWLMNTGSTELLFGLNCGTHLGTILLAVLQVSSNLLMLIALLITLLIAAPIPALIFLTSMGGLGYLVLKAVRKIVDRAARKTYSADRRLYATQQTAVHGLKEMRIYRREQALYLSYKKDLEAVKRAKTVQQTITRLPVSSLEILGFSTLIVIMCYLVFIQNTGMVQISGIMGFMAAAAWRALPVANRTIESLSSVRVLLPYIKNIARLISLERNMAPQMMPLFDNGQKEKLEFKQQITLENVGFGYPNTSENCLKNVSFTIKKGQMIGIVGFSGSGKSTLVNVLCGLLPHDSGRILIDDTSLERQNTPQWLDNIGYVAQSPFILNASLAENIALAKWGEEIDQKQVMECCKMAALDFVENLENGLDTILGEHGVRLSGGEVQRVAIARALYNNPELIVFDEATSSLDIKNEQAIHHTVLSLRNQITMIIIAHRLSTVEACDYLIWLDKGKIRMMDSVDKVMPEYRRALESME